MLRRLSPRRHQVGTHAERADCHAFFDASGDLFGGGLVGIGQDNEEFIGSVATYEVLITHRSADPLSDCSTDGVAGEMPEIVFDQLEVVHVQHQHTARRQTQSAGQQEGFALATPSARPMTPVIAAGSSDSGADPETGVREHLEVDVTDLRFQPVGCCRRPKQSSGSSP
jgi:hypothetical protein